MSEEQIDDRDLPVLLTDIGEGVYKVFLKDTEEIIGYINYDFDAELCSADLVPTLDSAEMKTFPSDRKAVRALYERHLESARDRIH